MRACQVLSGEPVKPAAYIHIFVDGRDVRLLEGLNTPITPEARISIFPPIAGG